MRSAGRRCPPPSTSLRGAIATKQSSKASRLLQAALDCFAPLAMTSVLAARPWSHPSSANDVHEPTNGPPQQGGERRKARSRCRACASSGAPPALRLSRRAPLLGSALASRRSTAALTEILPSAQSGPALHGSADMRYPGSQLLADLRLGRPGEFPNRLQAECMAPPAGTALAPSRGVPSAERPLTN
jgi:hypothetical protein